MLTRSTGSVVSSIEFTIKTPDDGGPKIRIRLAAARILLDQFYSDKSDLSVTPEDFSIMLSAATAAALT